MNVHYTSNSSEWGTPLWLFNEWNNEFHFTLDVCASEINKKVDHYFSKKDEALSKDWGNNVCWMNPPYGRDIKYWIRKAYEASKKGATVVCLIPSRTDTAWWHDYVMKGEITFIRGRVQFELPGSILDNAPFPSAVVVFKCEQQSWHRPINAEGFPAEPLDYAKAVGPEPNDIIAEIPLIEEPKASVPPEPKPETFRRRV